MKIKLGIAVIFLCILAFLGYLSAQVPVTLSPMPFQQFFTASGIPLTNGCIFTYSAGTSNPQATYTDSTGLFQNPNPIILDGGGFAPSGIWVTASAYRFVLFSQGGVNCATGTQQRVIDNFSPPPALAGNNPWTGNETHAGTETFNGLLVTNAGGSFNGIFTGNYTFNGTVSGSGVATATLRKGTANGTDYTTSSGVYVDVDAVNLAYTVTIPVGFKLLVSASGLTSAMTGNDTPALALYDATTFLVGSQPFLVNSVAVVTFSMNYMLTGDGASHTVKLRFEMPGGSDTLHIVNGPSVFPVMTFLLTPSN